MKENALSKKLRAAPAEKAVTPNSDSVHEEIASLATHTDEGKATIAGIYLQLWQVIRDARKLHQSTAKHYDRTIVRMVLPYFNDKAFEDMTEDDFLNRWDILLKSDIKPYAVQTAATVIRALVEEANKLGLTQTTLWGIPQFSDSDYLATFLGYEEKTYEEFAEKEANRLANIGVRIPRSIPLDKEIELFKWLVDNWREHGELIAGLIMLCTGARTSEATGFSYRYFCEVSPGYWALVRYEVSRKDSRKTAPGGKTNNAFRLLPVPRFLAEILLERKEALEKLFPEEDIEDFPLACRGTDYKMRCRQDELNQSLKNIYKRIAIDEAIMMAAYHAMHQDPSIAEDVEKKATAYLCRHVFATAAVYSGCDLSEVTYLMGHKEEVEGAKKADYSNPDQFRKLADKISRRPVIQIFDNLAAEHAYSYTGEPLRIVDDGDVQIHFTKAGQFNVTLMGLECNDHPQIKGEGIRITDMIPCDLPQIDSADTLSIRNQLRQCGERVWEIVQQQETKLPVPVAWVDTIDSDSISEVPPLRVIFNAAPARHNVVADDNTKPIVGDSSPAGISAPLQGNANLSPHRSESSAADISLLNTVSEEKNGREVQYATSESKLYLLSHSSGYIRELPLPLSITNRDRVGSLLLHDPSLEFNVRILEHCPQKVAYVLRPDGMIFLIPKGQRIDDPDFCKAENSAYEALRNGGILLQEPPQKRAPQEEEKTGSKEDSPLTIVCLAQTGRMRRMALASFGRKLFSGRKQVELEDGEAIVSACLCPESSDILVVSSQGQALRVSAKDLLRVEAGSGLILGMTLQNGDTPVCCIPYKEGQEYVAVTRFGKAVRLKGNMDFHAHGRQSQGKKLMKVNPKKKGIQNTLNRLLAVFPAEDALLLVNNQGRQLCIHTEDISAVGGVAEGVITMKLTPGEEVISAVSMIYDNAQRADTPFTTVALDRQDKSSRSDS